MSAYLQLTMAGILALALSACGGGGGGDGGSGGISNGSGGTLSNCKGSATVAWVDGAWVQPVPSWGSPVRLSLMLPIDTIVSNQLGAYGSHQGAHTEGLDHVWIQSTNFIQTGASSTLLNMAPGTVTRIDSNGVGLGYSVTVDYGQGLIGKHMQVIVPAVKVGDTLKLGDAVGTGAGITGEYTLQDQNRCDGELSQVGGYSYVSPFDYLKPDVQAALVAKFQSEVALPYFNVGRTAPTAFPWEPYLTNPMLFHSQHLGTITGEWMLANKGWNPEDSVYWDKFTVMDVTNTYGHFQQYVGANGSNPSLPGGPTVCSAGAWSLPDNSGKILFQDRFGGSPCYGIYKVEENQNGPAGSTSKLTLEWSTQTYPAAFTANAAVYYARLPVYASLNATLLGRPGQ